MTVTSRLTFIFKSKKINLDCFTKTAGIAELFPISRSFNHIPDWWRKVKPSYYVKESNTGENFESPTMKGCPGIVNLYKKGFVIPLWTDFDMYVEESDYRYLTPSNEFNIESHNEAQHGYALSQYHHIKIISPWLFKETKGIDFLFLPCTWSHLVDLPKINVLPGMTNFKHMPESHINCMIPKIKTYFRTSAGTPLVQLIPFTDRSIKLNIQIVTEQEWNKIKSAGHRSKFIFNNLSTFKK